MAVINHSTPRKRSSKIPFASPHGLLYAVPVSIALWVTILLLIGVIR